MLKGFKDFIMRGNVIDLAVGVIIGGAFSTVITALVSKVLMPAISWATGGSPNFDSWLQVGPIQFGAFLTAVVNFLIIAAALYFCIVMPINVMNERRKKKLGLEDVPEPVDPEIALLTEIRDALVPGKNVTGAMPVVDPDRK